MAQCLSFSVSWWVEICSYQLLIYNIILCGWSRLRVGCARLETIFVSIRDLSISYICVLGRLALGDLWFEIDTIDSRALGIVQYYDIGNVWTDPLKITIISKRICKELVFSSQSYLLSNLFSVEIFAENGWYSYQLLRCPRTLSPCESNAKVLIYIVLGDSILIVIKCESNCLILCAHSVVCHVIFVGKIWFDLRALKLGIL